jgi:hypothetical protein
MDVIPIYVIYKTKFDTIWLILLLETMTEKSLPFMT